MGQPAADAHNRLTRPRVAVRLVLRWFAEAFGEDVGGGAGFPGLDRGPGAGDGGVEGGAFCVVETVASVVDGEIELRPFREVGRLVYDETAVANSGANRRHHGESSARPWVGLARVIWGSCFGIHWLSAGGAGSCGLVEECSGSHEYLDSVVRRLLLGGHGYLDRTWFLLFRAACA